MTVAMSYSDTLTEEPYTTLPDATAVNPAAGPIRRPPTGDRRQRPIPASGREGSPGRLRPMAVPRAFGGWQVSFAALAAIWGCSFWWIKLGLESLTPVEVAFGRLLLGSLALATISAASRTALPRSLRTWRDLAVLALLLNSVPFTLFAFGETHISSVLAGIINATTPLATLVVLLVAFPEERPTRDRVVGLLVGFLGVLILLGVWQGIERGEALGVAACVGAVCCYGVAFPYARRHLTGLPEGPLALATGQVGLGAAFLLPVVILAGLRSDAARPSVTTSAILGMLALGVLGSGIAYVLNFRIIAAVGAATASAVTYLTPIFAVGVGIAFLGESITWNEPIGGVVVLLGIAISQGRLQRRSTARSRLKTAARK